MTNSAGDYVFDFSVGGKIYSINLKIEKHHYNIVSLDDSVIIEDDRILAINKGQILNLDFSVSGMFHLQKTSIYINAIDFINKQKRVEGKFNGVDINNNIVSGIVSISKINTIKSRH